MRCIRMTCLVLTSLLFLSGCSAEQGTANDEASAYDLTGKTVLMVIAPEDFRDEELFVTREKIENAKAVVTLASTTTDEATGMKGGTAKPDTTIAASDGSAYDAVVFVGGSGTTVLIDDPTTQNLAKTAYNGGKLVAAICMGPEILANAGLLNGVKATCWSGGKENLEAKGAIFVDEPVVTDGRFITGNGPGAASEFGETIVAYLAKKQINNK